MVFGGKDYSAEKGIGGRNSKTWGKAQKYGRIKLEIELRKWRKGQENIKS